MKYRSTLRNSPEVSLRDAVLRGSAPDGGLYMPVEIPQLKKDFLKRLPSLTFPEIAHDIGATYWVTTLQIAPIFPEDAALFMDVSNSNSPFTQYLSW